MFRSSRIFAPVVFCLFSGLAFGAGPLTLDVDVTYEGYAPTWETAPVTVHLRNDGPDARGVLHVSGSAFSMDYPVDLPRGSEKRLITYPNRLMEGVQYLLSTNRGSIRKEFNLNTGYGDGAATTVLMVGDSPGQLGFIRSNPSKPQVPGMPNSGQFQDVYVRPEDTPDRPLGFEQMGAVFLGAGAERLNDEQVHALHAYVLSGGTLVFVGGASSPILSDGRWTDTLPARDFRVVTLDGSNSLAELGGVQAPRASMLSGNPVSGALVTSEHGNLISAERGFGLGKVVYLAFNPFEPPLSRWEGRRSAVNRLVRPSRRAGQYIAFLRGEQYGGEGAVRSPIGQSAQQDPFSTTLPPTERVFGLLIAYFVVVVPLNFIILRKLKRGELAWVTAPIISLGFAGAFFFSAKDLYSATMSTASNGVLLVQQGDGEGIFAGSSRLFIPRGGSYDFGLSNVDSLDSEPEYEGAFSTRSTNPFVAFNPVDDGAIHVPHMEASNLDFRQIAYRQRVDVNQWYSSRLKDSSPGWKTLTFQNRSPYDLTEAVAYVGIRPYPLGTVPSGSEKSIKVSTAKQPVLDPKNTNAASLERFLDRQRRIAVSGVMKGYRPGPQLGTQVENRTRIVMTYFANDALGANP